MTSTVTAIADDVVSIAKLAVRHLRPNHITGEPVVLLHGIFSDASTLQRLARELAISGHEVWVPNFHEHTIQGNIVKAQSVVNMIVAQHGKVVLIAHSEGCVLASHVAGDESLVMGLVYIAPPVNGLPMSWEATTRFPKYLPQILVCALTGTEIKLSENDCRHLFFGQGGSSETATVVAEQPMVVLGAALSVKHIVAHPDIPTMVIAPTNDRLVRSPRALAQHIGAQYTEVPGGHMVPVTNPSALVNAIESWFRRISFPVAA
jgi:pimeloyl-ACP methyl ester carboxylesterase